MMKRRDPIADEIASFDEDDLPELGPEWDAVAAGAAAPADGSALGEAARAALAPDELSRERVVRYAGTHYRKVPEARRAWWPFAGLFAAAVGILVAVSSGDATRYEAEWRSGARPVRGDGAPAPAPCASRDPNAPHFVGGGRFEVVFAPERAVRRARATATVGGAALDAQVGDNGVVQVRGTVGEGALALEPGWHCLEAQVSGQPFALGFWIDRL
jgi:hypothetical protein